MLDNHWMEVHSGLIVFGVWVKILNATGVSKARKSGLHTIGVVISACFTVIVEPVWESTVCVCVCVCEGGGC